MQKNVDGSTTERCIKKGECIYGERAFKQNFHRWSNNFPKL